MDINRKIFEAQQQLGKKSAAPLPQIHIGAHLSDQAASLHQAHNQAHLICDKQTYQALGEKLHHTTHLPVLILDDNSDSPLKADETNIQHIRDVTHSATLLIAVGSGTINDLTKYAAYLDHKPYAIWGTAPSMNGYLSSNASITSADGAKMTVKAQLPAYGFFDTEILKRAPKRLTLAGIGDSLCRATVQFDWLLSHLLTDSDYTAELFTLTHHAEHLLLARANEFASSAPTAVSDTVFEALIELLLLSGYAMHLAGGSQPASQGEHMLAHYLDMFYPPHHDSLHGEHIAITTPIMAHLQRTLLASDHLLAVTYHPESYFIRRYGEQLGIYFHEQYQQKFPAIDTLHEINHTLSHNWPIIHETLSPLLHDIKQAVDALKTAGCNLQPHSVGWHNDHLKEAIESSYLTRNRFTTLDFLLMHPDFH